MEHLETQQKIIELGKTIVMELKLDPGVDTLSKWMSHSKTMQWQAARGGRVCCS